MQALKELVYIVNKNKLRTNGAIRLPFAEGSNLHQLYEGISRGTFQSDEEAATAICQNPEPGSNYRKLKTHLTKRLIDALFFIDLKKPSYTDRQRAYQECYKNWAAVKILLGENAREAGTRIAKQVLTQAEKFEFTHICMDITRTLRMHYGAMIGEEKLYNHYKELYQHYQQLYLLENQAEEGYTELMMQQSRSKNNNQGIKLLAELYYQELEPAFEKYHSNDLLFYGTLIRLTAYAAVNDYAGVLRVCEEAIPRFEQKPFVARIPLQVFQYQKIISLIQLRQIREEDFGRLIAEKPKFLREGTYNWYRFQEAFIILGLHTRHYQQAFQILTHAVRHERFEFLPADQQEYWKILETYLQYLHEIGKIKIVGEGHIFPKFGLGRFQNETLISSKDKRGINVPILIAQLLFSINRRKFSQIVDRIEAIEQYCSRYLHKRDTIRAFYFIKMLLTLPKNGFHKEAIIRKSANYFKRLQEYSLDIANQSFFIEIIIFEDLWEMVLENLDRKFTRIPKQQAKVAENS